MKYAVHNPRYGFKHSTVRSFNHSYQNKAHVQSFLSVRFIFSINAVFAFDPENRKNSNARNSLNSLCFLSADVSTSNRPPLSIHPARFLDGAVGRPDFRSIIPCHVASSKSCRSRESHFPEAQDIWPHKLRFMIRKVHGSRHRLGAVSLS